MGVLRTKPSVGDDEDGRWRRVTLDWARYMVLGVAFVASVPFTACASEDEPVVGLLHGPLGDRIGLAHEKALHDAVAILEGHPSADRARPKLDALFAESEQTFLAFGRERKAMPAIRRRVVDQTLTRRLMRRDPKMHAKIIAHHAYYEPFAPDVAERLIDFNLLMVYPDLEALRIEMPETAKRLGL